MTPAEKLAAATAALDVARRAIEAIDGIVCGDDEIDEAVNDAGQTLDAEIGGLYRLIRECVE